MNQKRQEFRATHQNREPTTADLDHQANVHEMKKPDKAKPDV
jgi:hypothetical protein